jgi:cell shape-determining protein MreC
MRRLLIILLALVLISLPVLAAPDYKALYEQAMADALAWQDQAFELSAEVGRQKQLVEDALKLYETAERDGDLLRAEIGRLTQELEARDSIIEIQAQQLKRLMGTERYAWLITGILGGAIGYVLAPNK